MFHFNSFCFDSLIENYSDSLSDATLAIELQPSFAKAILSGETFKGCIVVIMPIIIVITIIIIIMIIVIINNIVIVTAFLRLISCSICRYCCC